MTPSMRIVDVVAFDAILKDMSICKLNLPTIENMTSGMYYSHDLKALAQWVFSLIRDEGEVPTSGEGNIIIKRVSDAKLCETTNHMKEQTSFVHGVALEKEKAHERLQLQYRHVFSAYD